MTELEKKVHELESAFNELEHRVDAELEVMRQSHEQMAVLLAIDYPCTDWDGG